MMGIEHAGLGSSLIRTVRKNIPAAEDDVFQLCQLDEVLDARRTAFGALPEANCSHLCERTNRLGLLRAHKFDAGHEGCGNRTHSRQQHSQLPFRRGNTRWLFHAYPQFQFVGGSTTLATATWKE